MFSIKQFIRNRAQALEELDSKRFEVENIRALFGLPYPFAEFLCEKAVDDGYFEKWIALKHPTTGRLLTSYNAKEAPPSGSIKDTQAIFNEDSSDIFPEDEYDETSDEDFEPSQLKPLTFYKIADEDGK